MIDTTALVGPSEMTDLPDLLVKIGEADDDRDASAAIGAMIAEIVMRDRPEAPRPSQEERDPLESTPPSLMSG